MGIPASELESRNSFRFSLMGQLRTHETYTLAEDHSSSTRYEEVFQYSMSGSVQNFIDITQSFSFPFTDSTLTEEGEDKKQEQVHFMSSPVKYAERIRDSISCPISFVMLRHIAFEGL